MGVGGGVETGTSLTLTVGCRIGSTVETDAAWELILVPYTGFSRHGGMKLALY